MSQDPGDRRRLDSIPETQTTWLAVLPGRGKGDDMHFGPWYCYLDGRNPDYPRRILEEQYAEVRRRMDTIHKDHGDPETWDVHHWQRVNPVHTEALIQLTCGGPQIIYHGGLLHVRLRYFDMEKRRPGLPGNVAALVTEIDGDSTTVEMINTSPSFERRMVVQAGAFGEHSFTTAEILADNDKNQTMARTVSVDAQHVEIALPPGHSIRLRLGMCRYCNSPSYRQPF
jgi:hypothetical protein